MTSLFRVLAIWLLVSYAHTSNRSGFKGGILRERGFIKLRREMLEDLEAGMISLIDFAVYNYLSLKANVIKGCGSSLPPGICKISAVAIHAVCPRQISERTIQRSLEHLEGIGWIKRWNLKGKRGNYPILLCRSAIHDLSGKEYRINREASVDWRNPVLEPRGELSSLPPEADAQLAGDIDMRRKILEREKTNPAPKTVAKFVLPDWVPLDTWTSFVQMREDLRKPMTRMAMKLAIKKLEQLRASGEDPNEVLEQSIMNSWRGLFAVSY